jgi:hypothetical protein
MSEELKQPQIIENPAAEETELPPAQEAVALQVAVPTAVSMWNDAKMMNQSFRMARMLSSSALVPDSYRNSPENCVVAIDIANRMGISPLMVMQSLYVVKGKPSWSGSFCAAAINGSGRFTPLEFEFVGEEGKPSWGCYATAIRVANGKRCYSDVITIGMAQKEGWYSKKDKYGNETSKWQSMPRQMMMYRSAAFFARAHCSDILLGYYTVEEIQDTKGYEEEGKQTIVTLDQKDG